ncbi:MAG: manganese efflux pump MntP family protein [Lachnospiraceae bacterium]|nr:manganese efflux pump MntP family protein [Lachnospiraceae bacterium]
MDAFTVSLADGLYAPDMKRWQRVKIAFTFAFFQFMMPLVGWIFVHTIAQVFTALQRFIPWIGCALLWFVGGKMILEGIKGWKEKKDPEAGDTGNTGKESAGQDRFSAATLFLQGVATSIDALSVGVAIAAYSAAKAIGASLIIGVVTFLICGVGLRIGRRVGVHLADEATVFGGVILIGIGVSLFF